MAGAQIWAMLGSFIEERQGVARGEEDPSLGQKGSPNRWARKTWAEWERIKREGGR